jgi:hypothetical protein
MQSTVLISTSNLFVIECLPEDGLAPKQLLLHRPKGSSSGTKRLRILSKHEYLCRNKPFYVSKYSDTLRYLRRLREQTSCKATSAMITMLFSIRLHFISRRRLTQYKAALPDYEIGTAISFTVVGGSCPGGETGSHNRKVTHYLSVCIALLCACQHLWKELMRLQGPRRIRSNLDQHSLGFLDLHKHSYV